MGRNVPAARKVTGEGRRLKVIAQLSRRRVSVTLNTQKESIRTGSA